MTANEGETEKAVAHESAAPEGARIGGVTLNVRTLLWASLVFVPIALIAELAHVDETYLFVLSVLALIPLAWLIGEATEQAGGYVGAFTAGLLNASFGNAPELIIALVAVADGLFEVVRGSLVGSVIGNLLLVLGCSLAVGGKAAIDRRTAFGSLGMVALAMVLFGISSVFGYQAEGPAHQPTGDATLFWAASIIFAAVLLVVYVVATVRSVKRDYEAQHEDDGEDEGHGSTWSLRVALIVLGVAMLATVAVSHLLTGTIEAFASSVGLSDLFVALVIVAIAGNCAEHGGAIVIASRGNVLLAAEIGLQSSAQVAVGLIPLVVLLSLVINPFGMAFPPVEIFGMAVATVLPAILLYRGVSTRTRGLILCVAYAALVVMFLKMIG